MKHNKLTIVSVFGHNDGSAAIPSIVKSMEELPGSRGLLLSPMKPKNLPTSVEWKRIGHLTYKQYSVFMMHSLYAFIKTDYCLVVQEDSWVLNGKMLTKEFYQYDYIGPPTHCGFQFNKENMLITALYLKYQWIHYSNIEVVQNGGFSLRSKRFLEACNVHGITHTSPDPIPLTNMITNKHDGVWSHIWNEDVHLTGLLKHELINYGYKFAPLEVASRFAIEYLDPILHTRINFDKIVGHHAKSRILLDNNQVMVPNNMSDMENSTELEKELIHWMSTKKGYTITVDPKWASEFTTTIPT